MGAAQRQQALFAAVARAQAVARMPEERRAATLLAFARTLEAGTQDDVLDLFDVVVAKLFADAALVGKRARLRTIRDLDAAALRLHHVDGGRISGQRGGARAGHREAMFSTGRCRTFDLPTRFTPQYLNDRKNLERVRELAASAKVRVFGPIRRSTAFNTETAEDAPAESIRPDARAIGLCNLIGEALLHGSQQAARRVRAYPQPHRG